VQRLDHGDGFGFEGDPAARAAHDEVRNTVKVTQRQHGRPSGINM